MLDVIEIIIVALEVLASLALIAVVLVQSGKEAGLSGALVGNMESFMNKSKLGSPDKLLAAATKWIALAWAVLALVLSFFPV